MKVSGIVSSLILAALLAGVRAEVFESPNGMPNIVEIDANQAAKAGSHFVVSRFTKNFRIQATSGSGWDLAGGTLYEPDGTFRNLTSAELAGGFTVSRNNRLVYGSAQFVVAHFDTERVDAEGIPDDSESISVDLTISEGGDFDQDGLIDEDELEHFGTDPKMA